MKKKTSNMDSIFPYRSDHSKRSNLQYKETSSYAKIIKSFRDLVLIKDFEKITVAEICKYACVSRKTFYENFRDKNDIVEQIVLTSISEPLLELSTLLPKNDVGGSIILEWLYQQFYNDRKFYEKISFFTGQNSLQDFVIEHTSAIVLSTLEDMDIPNEEKEYMAYFYATSHAVLLIKWIRDKMVVPPKTMASYYEKWTLPFWIDLHSKKSE